MEARENEKMFSHSYHLLEDIILALYLSMTLRSDSNYTIHNFKKISHSAESDSFMKS